MFVITDRAISDHQIKNGLNPPSPKALGEVGNNPRPPRNFFLSSKRRFLLGVETFSSFLSISAEIIVFQILDVAMAFIAFLVSLTEKSIFLS